MTKARPSAPSGITLHTGDGQRKYLTPTERRQFIAHAKLLPRARLATLCLLLALTGCRISEALALRATSFDFEDGVVSIVSLKKRGRLLVRDIPIPQEFCAMIVAAHGIARPASGEANARLWTWSRSRAWFLIKHTMLDAGIAAGPHCTIKGLRHAFGVHAIGRDVPLNLLQRWLGHASLSTTAIYASAIGPEERRIAARMWE